MHAYKNLSKCGELMLQASNFVTAMHVGVHVCTIQFMHNKLVQYNAHILHPPVWYGNKVVYDNNTISKIQLCLLIFIKIIY
jgi:hypothetical protein